MATKLSAIALVVLCTVFTSIGMIFWKIAADNGLPALLFTWQMWLGCFLYALGAAILISSFKRGDVTVLFPIISTSYIWVTLLSSRLFSEAITIFKWLGIASIVLGVTILGMGGRKK